jgi:cytochrome d ubiquinol oxidase subunit II
LLGGLVTLTLFFAYGLVFITLKTDGEVRVRARALATKVGAVSTLLAAGFLVWTLVAHFSWLGLALSGLAAVALIGALLLNHFGRDGWSFVLMVITVVSAVGSLFAALFPNVLPSTTNPAFSLTIENASSTPYTLTVMTWVVVFCLPLVLAYQAWTYWVFSKRVSRKNIPAGGH